MASNSLETLTPERESLFRETVVMTLYTWDAFSISAANDPRASVPGSIDEIRANLGEAIFDEFASSKLPDSDDLQDLLFEFMDTVFEVVVDDDSLAPTSELLIRRYRDIARGEFGEIEQLRAKFEERKAKGGDRSVNAQMGEVDQETDGSDEEESDDDEDGDVDRMDGVVGQQPARREKPVPEVDEDGFTTVTRRR